MDWLGSITGISPAGAIAGLMGLVVLVLGIFGIKKSAEAEGKAEGELIATQKHDEVVNEANEATIAQNAALVEKLEEVHEIHDRLESDPAYRERVRDRFTRPD